MPTCQPEPSDDDVLPYALFMQEKTGAKIKKSSDSGLELVSTFLDAIGVVNKQEHLSSFGVTLGVTISVPFDIDKPTLGWSPRSKIRLIAHECTHVLQFLGKTLSMENVDDPQIIFAWDYVHSEESRAYLEAEAYASDQEVSKQLWDEEPDPAWVEEQLRRSYAMQPSSSKFAEKCLETRKRVTMRGQYSAQVTKLTLEFFRARQHTIS